MNQKLVKKVTGMVMEELRSMQLNQSKGFVKLWPHQHPAVQPIILTDEAISHEFLDGKVHFSDFPKS